jgi:uncharacterized protein YbjT (DUF2867 family)
MAILVTGSTGVIGQQILKHLNGSGAEVRALTRTPEKAQFPAGVTAVKGDLSDVDAVRQAINGVSTLFLLAPNAADELVVPPLLTEFRSRGHAAMGNFCFGGTPPMAVFGRS